MMLVVIIGFLVHNLIKTKQPTQPSSPLGKTQTIEKPPVRKPAFEIYPKEDVPARKPRVEPKADLHGKTPKVAIIIDDLGYDRVMAEKFFKLESVLTFSVLPHSTFHRKIAEKAYAKGFEVMLHLPMEPLEYPTIDPGLGALFTSMTPDQLIEQLNANLEAVPYIKGVNNHMGSKMTIESAKIYQIFSVLKKRNLFFIDSRTTKETICKPSARLFKLRFAQRDIFLDNIQEAGAIRKQIEKLIFIANNHGEAIGIAHPHNVTYEVLRKELPRIEKKLELVPASKLVKRVG
jgi:polysaccharide deacetylase 2 family uncharacterized protein YibQ